MISCFKNNFSFLSNFSESKIEYKDYTYSNAEAAFHAQKNESSVFKLSMQFCDPSLAKKEGRRIKLRPDWEEVKDNIMYEIVKAKFEQNKYLKIRLLLTKDKELVEGNSWHDNYWGVCRCERCIKVKHPDSNNLGRILMKVREELRGKQL